jgi:predicted DNA-binding protein
MMVTIDIPAEIEDRLKAEAQACGVPLAEFVRAFIIDRYQEEEDRRIAGARLDDPHPPVSGARLRKNLGLDS